MLLYILLIVLPVLRINLAILLNLEGPTYARKHDTILINCSTDTLSVGLEAEIIINSKTFTIMRSHKNECFSAVQGIKCVSDVCLCSSKGYWFAHRYQIDIDNGTSTITCAMKFGADGSTKVSDSIEVNIIDFSGPTLKIEGKVPLNAGTEARVVCEIFTQLKDIRIAWNCVEHGHVNERNVANRYQSTLTFKVKPYHQNKKCICAGIFKEFQSTAAMQLDVNNKPVLMIPENSYCNTSSSVELSCTVVDEQSTFGFYPWTHLFNSIPVRYLSGVTFWNISTLEISTCTYQDAGEYICGAWNKYNDRIYDSNSSTTLTVHGPPIITSANVLRTTSVKITVEIYSTSVIEKPVWMIMSDQQDYATDLNSTFRSTNLSLPVYRKKITCQGYVTTWITDDIKDITYTVLLKNIFGETRKHFALRSEMKVSFDLRVWILGVSVFGVFILATTVTIAVLRGRQYNSIVHIVGPLERSAIIPIYHSAPESQNDDHVYERTNPHYLELIENVQERHYSEVKDEEGEMRISGNDTDEDYEEID